jgi:hypothetical protein
MPVTQVASTTTSTQLLPTNGSRYGFTITNTDPNRLYVLYDVNQAASSSLHSFYLDQYDYYECAGPNVYRDKISVVWAADGSGNANVSEW